MNPIIKALAEQAGMNIKTNIIGTARVFGTSEWYKTSHITAEELEKFAELIVRQSAKVGSHYGVNVGHLILHYFGVEP